MHLSQPDRNGKVQRACTPQSHEAIKQSEALFLTLTTPCGYQDCRDGRDHSDDPNDVGAQVLELGTCRNCGSTIARVMSTFQVTMWELAIGDIR